MRRFLLFPLAIGCALMLTRCSWNNALSWKGYLEQRNIPAPNRHWLGGLSNNFAQGASYQEILGNGTYGSVRRVTLGESGDQFAVKIRDQCRPTLTKEECHLSVRKEYWIASHISHPNVAEVYDLLYSNGDWHLVMEYCEFELLHSVQSLLMTDLEIACIFKQLLLAVRNIHENDIAHLDLKLENILLDSQGSVKIVDFGSADLFRIPSIPQVVFSKGLHGSLATLSPEVLTGKEYDPRLVDTWSLGVIFVAMQLRLYPWDRPRLWDKSYRLFLSSDDSFVPSRQWTSVHELPQLPFNLARGPSTLFSLLPIPSRLIISKMLAVNPQNRATIEEVLHDPWISSIEICAKSPKLPQHNHVASLVSRESRVSESEFPDGYFQLLFP